MDEYKKKLAAALADYAKELEVTPAEFFFRAAKNDYDYQWMSEMDALSLGLDERGALRFAISHTRQGEQGEPYLDVSYWSSAIEKQISWGECIPNIESPEQFVEWAAEIRAEMDELEKRLKPHNIVIECSGGVVNNVHGLRNDETYEIADWDEVDDEPAHEDERGNTIGGIPQGVTTETLQKMIADAQTQN